MGWPDRQVSVHRGPGGRNLVSLLDEDWVREHGLHPEAILGAVGDDLDPLRLKESGLFLLVLSRVIYENVTHCPDALREAELQGEGVVFLLDRRTPDPGGRVPPEDILGTVTVADGKPVAGSYRHNRRHKLYTAHGWFRLSEHLEEALQSRLRVTD
jgi:hypothetical protein